MKRYEMMMKKGFSLLEMLLVMSVIAVLLIGVARYYEAASTSEKENEGIRLVQAIKAAGERYRLANGPAVDNIVDNLIARNLLPATAKNNPWGGTVTVKFDSNSNMITATFSAIPQGACQNLAGIFNVGTSANPPARCSEFSTGDAVTDFEINF